MITIPSTDDVERETWETLLELDRRLPEGWTLIGAQMVALHGYEHGRPPPRRSMDADVLVNVRLLPAGTARVATELEELGFRVDGMSPEEIAHRFRRGDVSIDVLGPDGLRGLSDERRRRLLLTVPPGRTIEVPGGTKALNHSQRVAVQVADQRGFVPRPDLLGAIIVKACAIGADDAPDNQRQDLAFLCSLVPDPRSLSAALRPKERSLLRDSELLQPDADAWIRLGGAGEDAYHAYQLLIGA